MKFLKSSTDLFSLAFLLIVVTNIFILTNVYLNRSGESTTSIVLTEREVHIPYYNNSQNNALSLKIKWRVLNENNKVNYYYNKQASWLNKTKLQSLGFDIDKITKQRKYKPVSHKEVFLVLEYDAQAYQKTLKYRQTELEEKEKTANNKKIKDAREALHVEQHNASRLFIIDANLDYESLRHKYKDTSKYIIAKGIVKAHYNIKTKTLSGYINRLSVPSLHVELKYKQILKQLTKNKALKYNSAEKPRYKVKVEYGSRYEPWISSVSLYK